MATAKYNSYTAPSVTSSVVPPTSVVCSTTSHSQPTTPEKQKYFAGYQSLPNTTNLTQHPGPSGTTGNNNFKNNYQNYFRFELKCGNTSFVYEKNINRNN